MTAATVAHTPGPWRVVPPPTHDNGNPWRVVGGDHTIAIVPNRPRETDARLIAAAPELLAAVKELIDPDVQGTINQEREARMYALVAKAEGRSEL